MQPRLSWKSSSFASMHFVWWVWIVLITASTLDAGEDWPTHQHDNHRTGYSAEKFDLPKLRAGWVWRSNYHPQPAWAGPAKWDAYAGRHGLPSMRSYDLVFQPIIATRQTRTKDGTQRSVVSLLFGSSADDTVRCIDLVKGQQTPKAAWTFTTSGPIRVAPSVVGGNVYFASDDGHAYCVSAADGSLVWKAEAPHDKQRVLNNGKFISTSPCRTGVLVDEGRAYFGNSLLPWNDAWLTCVDAKTGKQLFQTKSHGLTLEGPMAATSSLLISPQGRVAPRVFNKADGKDRGNFQKSGGGSVVVVSLNAGILHGPAANPREGAFGVRKHDSLEMLAGFGKGNALVVSGKVSYQLTDTELIASDLVTRKVVWRAPSESPNSLIGCGDLLFAGGADHVAAFNIADGKKVWEQPVDGRVYGMAAGHGVLAVSTDQGVIHTFGTGDADAATATKAPIELAAQELPKLQEIKRIDDPTLVGRWVFQAPHASGRSVKGITGELTFEADQPLPLKQSGVHQSIELSGANGPRLIVRKDFNQAKLSAKEMSAAAWVRVDKPLTWGGIVGAFQDNGSYERGWVLGYRNSRFSFAMAANGGGGKMTYVTAPTDSALGNWHHVAGTYDGQVTKLFVDGKLVAQSEAQKGEINYPPNAYFEIGAYHDNDEDFRMTGGIHEVRVYRRVLSDADVVTEFRHKADRFRQPEPEHAQLAAGPWLKFTSPNSAVVRWQTHKPSRTLLSLDGVQQAAMLGLDTMHVQTLTALKRDRQNEFVIHLDDGETSRPTRPFLCDTFFNYHSMTDYLAPPSKRPSTDGPASRAAREILSKSGIKQGLCLVIGSGSGELAEQLAAGSNLRIVGFETDADLVRESRKMLLEAGWYGPRVTIHHVKSLDDIPVVGRCANLVVSETWMSADDCVGSASEVMRLLRPRGGMAVLGQLPGGSITANDTRDWSASTTNSWLIKEGQDGTWASTAQGKLFGAGDWSHLYGLPDNSAFGGEQLGGIRDTSMLDVQWLGRPGPRYQADRNGRKPSPLSTNGRLFMQGLHRIVTVDAYNGLVLWSLEIPEFQRFNMPRDCGNWCADDDTLYAAVAGECWMIEAETGRVAHRLPAIASDSPKRRATPRFDQTLGVKGRKGQPVGVEEKRMFDWGFIATSNDMLVGSTVKRGTAWADFWGKANNGWYDAANGNVTHKVCSDVLFGLDKHTTEERWRHVGLIVNPTITITDGKVYFAECRSEPVISAATRRVDTTALWSDLHLVCLNLMTGERVWEHPLKIDQGTTVFYLAAANEQLVSVCSGGGKYHVNSFATTTGDPQWSQSFAWPGGKSDHGKAMSRPAIVGGKIYVRPRVLELATGKLLPESLPQGGCGTYACSANSLFFRSGTITMWDTLSQRQSTWSRLRPDCWLSTIPAGGMLLSPEGGGGCSCGGWMETSIGFMPRTESRQQ